MGMIGWAGGQSGMLIATSGQHVAYVVLVAAHVVTALVGFGALALTGVYATTARHIERPGALEETVRYFRARAAGEWAIVAVPVLGILAVAVDPDGKGLGHLWVVLAMGLWLVAIVAAGAVARPARRALRAALPVEDRTGGPVEDPIGGRVEDRTGGPVEDPIGGRVEDRIGGPVEDPIGGPVRARAGAVDGGAVRAAATRLSLAAGICDVVFVLAVIDMVIRP